MREVCMAGAVLLLSLAVIPSHAQELKVDMDTAVDLAIENNLGLEADRVDLRTARRAMSNTWNEFLPTVDLGVGLDYSDRGRSFASFTPGDSPWDLTASISTRLPLSRASRYNVRDARLAFEAQDISLEEAERLLERDVKKDFFTLIVLRERIRLVEDDIATSEGRYDRARINYEEGLASELTVLRAQVTLENLRIDLEQAAVDYRIAEMRFKQLLGLDSDDAIDVDGTVDVETVSIGEVRLMEERISERFDVQALAKDIEILENQRKLTRAEEYCPILTLSYGYATILEDPFGADWGSAGSWSGGNSVGISLSLPLDPLVPGSPGRLRVKEVEDSIEKTRIELVETRQLAEIEIDSILLRIEKSLRTLNALERNGDLAERTYRLTEQEYEAGLTDLTVLEDVFDDLQEIRLDILEERYTYLEALFDLEYALNTRYDVITYSSE
jgi:outer membrane protein TolC